MLETCGSLAPTWVSKRIDEPVSALRKKAPWSLKLIPWFIQLDAPYSNPVMLHERGHKAVSATTRSNGEVYMHRRRFGEAYATLYRGSKYCTIREYIDWRPTALRSLLFGNFSPSLPSCRLEYLCERQLFPSEFQLLADEVRNAIQLYDSHRPPFNDCWVRGRQLRDV